MEAATIVYNAIPWTSTRQIPSHRRFLIRASSVSQGKYRVPKPKREWMADWISQNDDVVRSLPIYVGGASILSVLINRAVSGIPPVADASSSQSRADLLTLGLAVTCLLNGLVWLTIRPKTIIPVDPRGVECRMISSNLPDSVVSELWWAWESLSAVTCCRSLVVVYDCNCVLQIGVAAEPPDNGTSGAVDAPKLMQGSLCQTVIKSKAQRYLANLSLYPARSELPFFPSNTQAVILQPLGDKGVAILGGDTIRGFSTSDQSWITFLGEKLDATLSKISDQYPIKSVVIISGEATGVDYFAWGKKDYAASETGSKFATRAVQENFETAVLEISSLYGRNLTV